MATFSEQLRAIAAKNRKLAEEVVRETVHEVANRAVDRSPFGRWEKWSTHWKDERPMPPYSPGRFKGSWVYGNGTVPENDPQTVDVTGEVSTDRVNPAIAFATHYFINNTPYGSALEFGFLHAPNVQLQNPDGGAVAMTQLEFKAIVEETIVKLKERA